MNTKRFLYILPILFLFSCSEDFDVNADWEDITVVYGLLNPSESDSIQYIRITRGFTNEGASAVEIAKTEIDSIYHTDSLHVILEKWKNGNHIKPDIVLFKEYNEEKDEDGDFLAPQQYLYRTEKGVVLDKSYTYKLVITNTETGKVVSAETPLIDDMSQVIPAQNSSLHFDTSGESKIIWRPGDNAFFYDVDVIFKYYEYPLGKPSLREIKEIAWTVTSFYKTNSSSDEMEVSMEGKKFFELIYDKITAEENYKDYQREFPGNNIDIVYYAGGKEIYYYINVNEPSIGIVEKKPEYTNIDNGYGVFSCRNVNRMSTGLSSSAKDYLMTSDQTINLNFIE